MPNEGPSPSDNLIEQLLEVARVQLGMDLAWVSSFQSGLQTFEHFAGDAASFGLRPGTQASLGGSYCLRVIDGRLPNIVPDAPSHEIAGHLAITEQIGIGSYIGVPLTKDVGDAAGMLCCVSKTSAEHLGEADVRTMRALATLISEITASGPTERHTRMIADKVTRAIDTHAFRVVYQPIVDVESGTVVGVEALSRFDEPPNRPDIWFADAATVGLGVELELAAIQEALTGLQHMAEGVYMSLNASPATIRDVRLFTMLSATDPSRLVLEIAATTSSTEYDVLGPALISYRRLGVRIALDDVGAGFSSLGRIVKLAPDFVKVDRSVITGIDVDVAKRSSMRAIVEASHHVGAVVIAEGVEAPPELDMLATLRVGQAQGFLLARPGLLPAPLNVARVGRADETADMSDGFVAYDIAVRRFELAMLHSPHGMLIVGLDGSFLHANPAMEELSGYSHRELLGINHASLVHPAEISLDETLIAECLQGYRSSYRIERRYMRSDGTIVWADASIVLIRTARDEPLYFIAQLQDITERKNRELQLHRHEETDPLTGISNRAAALQLLRDLAADGTTFGVLCCDIEGFRQVNETFGHEAGDHVLMAVANRLQTATRDDDLVARWGDDEFIVILPHTSGNLLTLIAERAAARVAQPITFHPSGRTTIPSITVGTATYDPYSGDTIHEALRRADNEMNQSRGADSERDRGPDS